MRSLLLADALDEYSDLDYNKHYAPKQFVCVFVDHIASFEKARTSIKG